jgi:hypothetical protein
MGSPYASLDQRVSSGTSIDPAQDPVSYGAGAILSHLDPRPSAFQRGERLEEGYNRMLQREALGEASPGAANLWLESRFDDVQKYAPQLLGAGGQLPEVALSSDPTGGVLREPYTKQMSDVDIRSRYGIEFPSEEAPLGTAAAAEEEAGATMSTTASEEEGGSTMPTTAAGAQPPGGDRLGNLRNELDAARNSIQTLLNDDTFKSGMEGKLKDTQNIVNRQLGILSSGIVEQNRLTQKAIDDTADFETKRQTLVNAQRTAAEGVQQQIDTITSEIMNYEIDPNRAFKSTWQVVGAAIAAAAGAYAQGLSRNTVPNTALAIINKAIDRDIQAQKMELGRLQTAAGIKNNVFGRMLQLHGNELQALAETRAAAMSVVQLKLGTLRSTTASKVQAATINLMQKKMEIQQGQYAQQAKLNAAKAITTSIVNEMRTMTSGTAGKKSIAQRLGGIVVKIQDAINLFDRVTTKGALLHKWGAAKLIPTIDAADWDDRYAEEAAVASAYTAAITLAIKEVVSIFEGSKPSDLDWKVMIQLLPEGWESKNYAKRSLEKFLQRIKIAATSGEEWKEDTLYNWALASGETGLIDGAKDISKRDIRAFKKKLGFTEEE